MEQSDMSVFGGPDIITDGLVLHLDAANRKSYPGSGSTWYDLSGNGNNGTLTAFTGNSAGTTSGFDPNTKLMMFDRHLGSSDATANNRVLINNSDSLDQCLTTNGFTVSFWFKMTSYTCTAMTKWNGSWEVFYCTGLTFRTEGNYNDLQAGVYYGTYFNQFHLITTSHTGSTKNIYVNSSLVKTASNSAGSQNTTNQISIGAYADGKYASVGAIPAYHLYNRALSANEVQQNYNALKGRFGL
jgi:hypothetical protein